MTTLPAPDHRLRLSDGRHLAYDDRGDPDNTVLLYMHGTPDTRVARHPDDGIVTAHGMRLVATDRPGLGGSDPDPAATPTSVADDHAELLDALGVERVHVVAWSAGSIFATAFAGAHPDRVVDVTLIAPLIPADAYATPGVTEGAGAGRSMFAEMALDMDPDEAGRELAPWLVPTEVTDDVARDHLAESLAVLSTVPGADRAMIDALAGSVVQGMVGMEREIAAQATPLGGLLDAVRGPVVVHAGDVDDVCPPAMARWYVDGLHSAQVTLVEHADRGHMLAITDWPMIVAALV